jgi:hypothetical protein
MNAVIVHPRLPVIEVLSVSPARRRLHREEVIIVHQKSRREKHGNQPNGKSSA